MKRPPEKMEQQKNKAKENKKNLLTKNEKAAS